MWISSLKYIFTSLPIKLNPITGYVWLVPTELDYHSHMTDRTSNNLLIVNILSFLICPAIYCISNTHDFSIY